MSNRSLTRNQANRKIAGVCAGLADYFGVDVVLIRIVFLLGLLFGGGASFVVYIVLMIVMPKDSTTVGPLRHSTVATTIFGLILAALVVGGFVNSLRDGAVSYWVPTVGFIFVAIVLWSMLRRRVARRLRRQNRAGVGTPSSMPYAEPSSQEAPPTYFGGDPTFRLDSFYPTAPHGTTMYGVQPGTGATLAPYGTASYPDPAGPVNPSVSLNPDDRPSGFQN